MLNLQHPEIPSLPVYGYEQNLDIEYLDTLDMLTYL